MKISIKTLVASLVAAGAVYAQTPLPLGEDNLPTISTLTPVYATAFTKLEQQAILTGFQIWGGASRYQTYLYLGVTNSSTSIGNIIFKKISGTWPGHSVTGTQSWDLACVNVYASGDGNSGTLVVEVDEYTQVVVNGATQNVPWTNTTFTTNAWIRAAQQVFAGGAVDPNANLTSKILIPTPTQVAYAHAYPNATYPTFMGDAYGQNIAEPLFQFSVQDANGNFLHRHYAWGWAQAQSFTTNPPAGTTIQLTSARYQVALDYNLNVQQQQSEQGITEAVDASGNEFYTVAGVVNPCNPTKLTYSSIRTGSGYSTLGYTYSVYDYDKDYTATNPPIHAFNGQTVVQLSQIDLSAANPGSPLIFPTGYAGNECQEPIGYAIDLTPGM
jgi:hypothetical protein